MLKQPQHTSSDRVDSLGSNFKPKNQRSLKEDETEKICLIQKKKEMDNDLRKQRRNTKRVPGDRRIRRTVNGEIHHSSGRQRRGAQEEPAMASAVTDSEMLQWGPSHWHCPLQNQLRRETRSGPGEVERGHRPGQEQEGNHRHPPSTSLCLSLSLLTIVIGSLHDKGDHRTKNLTEGGLRRWFGGHPTRTFVLCFDFVSALLSHR